MSVKAKFQCKGCGGIHDWKYYHEAIVCQYCGTEMGELYDVRQTLATPNCAMWCNDCQGWVGIMIDGKHIACTQCGEYLLYFELHRVSELEIITPEISTAAVLLKASPEAVVEWNVKHYG